MIHTAVEANAANKTKSMSQEKTEQAPDNDAQESQALFFESHFPLVLAIANEMLHRLPPWMDRASLVQSGVVGLLDAARRYDARRAIRFRTYAAYRIKGEIIEYLRSLDIATRGVRAWGRTLTTARHRVLTRLGREASSEEMAAALNVSLARYHQIMQRVEDATLLSLTEAAVADAAEAATAQESFAPSPSRDPAAEIEQKDMVNKLTHTVKGLSAQERLVLRLYYEEELTLRQIGELLELTEGRICQIHAQAVARLRQALTRETPH